MSIKAPESIREFYPERAGLLRHALADDPRLSLDALARLAKRLPPSAVEYYPGDRFAAEGPVRGLSNGLNPEETVRRIEECRSWMVLKNVGDDPEYAALVDACLDALAPHVAAATGTMFMRVGFIFVSSPDAIVPTHLDPEHNVLMQIKGTKTVTVYQDPRLVPDDHHEAYHAGAGASFKLDVTPAYEAASQSFHISPGDALHIPLKAPHDVRNGAEPSISFSVTWRSEFSDRDARLRRANHAVRKVGGTPPAPGAKPLRDRTVILCQKAVSTARGRLGL